MAENLSDREALAPSPTPGVVREACARRRKPASASLCRERGRQRIALRNDAEVARRLGAQCDDGCIVRRSQAAAAQAKDRYARTRNAVAMCAGPVSADTSTSQAASAPMKSRNPARERARTHATPRTRATPSRGRWHLEQHTWMPAHVRPSAARRNGPAAIPSPTRQRRERGNHLGTNRTPRDARSSRPERRSSAVRARLVRTGPIAPQASRADAAVHVGRIRRLAPRAPAGACTPIPTPAPRTPRELATPTPAPAAPSLAMIVDPRSSRSCGGARRARCVSDGHDRIRAVPESLDGAREGAPHGRRRGSRPACAGTRAVDPRVTPSSARRRQGVAAEREEPDADAGRGEASLRLAPQLRVLHEGIEGGHRRVDDSGAAIENAEAEYETREHLPRDAKHVRDREAAPRFALAPGGKLRVPVDRVEVLAKRAILDVIEGAGQSRRAPLDDQCSCTGGRESRSLPSNEAKNPLGPAPPKRSRRPRYTIVRLSQ